MSEGLRNLWACYSMGGRWSPNEDRPMHATADMERSLCGVDNIEVLKETDWFSGVRKMVPFQQMTRKCKRCLRSIESQWSED